MRIFKKLFKIFFIVVFVLMLITQILLKNTFLKPKLSRLYEMETQYVFYEQEKPTGHIVLKITNPSKDIFVLQNGEKISTLDSYENKIEILDNSVIEIDSRESSVNNIVSLSLMTDNLKGFYENEIKLNSDIKILGRFFVK